MDEEKVTTAAPEAEAEAVPAEETEAAEAGTAETLEAEAAGKEKKFGRRKEADLKKKLEEQKAESDAALAAEKDKFLRLAAEYDNYRRRTGEEKDAIYGNAIYDVLDKILPIIDNLERASQYDGDKVAQGVKMTLTSFKSSLEALGVTEIECKTFDPNLHNAVMHVEDENYGEGEIVEVFQKGYQKGGKIIRYAMVKTAN